MSGEEGVEAGAGAEVEDAVALALVSRGCSVSYSMEELYGFEARSGHRSATAKAQVRFTGHAGEVLGEIANG